MMELRVQHLCKAYGGIAVLEDVSFTAGVGVTCVMAPSGAGKTTLLRLLLGLEAPDGGAVEPSGIRWAAVFQEDRLLEQLDARQNLLFALGPACDAGRAAEMLASLGLGAAAGRRVREYSGGMKRRLALARALLAESDALALDEPFAGLDPDNRGLAAARIRQAAETKPVLLVTHEEEDAGALGGRIVRL